MHFNAGEVTFEFTLNIQHKMALMYNDMIEWSDFTSDVPNLDENIWARSDGDWNFYHDYIYIDNYLISNNEVEEFMSKAELIEP